MITSSAAAPCAAIFQSLTELGQVTTRAVPAGTRGRLFRAIDELRSSGAPSDVVSKAEAVSVAVHQLDLAIRASDNKQITELKLHIEQLAHSWRETPAPTLQ